MSGVSTIRAPAFPRDAPPLSHEAPPCLGGEPAVEERES